MITLAPAAYYNEHDPYAAQWLRNLIDAGHIAPGIVDERDIRDVAPIELAEFRQCHFFAGIGVWSHALRQSGWPDDREIWTGSCPCQPFSAAGRRSGFTDERHLWPHWHWLIQQRRPAIVVGEQVASKDGLAWLDLVSADMENTRYAFGAVDICAAGFGAPEIRQRLYFAGIDQGTGQSVRLDDATGPRSEGAGRGEPHQSQGRQCRSELGCDCLRLVNTDSDGRTAGQSAPTTPRHGRSARPDGGTHGVDDAFSDRRLQGREDDHGRHDGKQPDANERPHGLAYALRGGQSGSGEMERSSDPASSADRQTDRIEHDGGRSERPGTHATNGFWGDADWLFGTDGFWRPVEPGTFPLADGPACRVGQLRSYGNALNAQQAIGFVEALIEVIG